MKSHISLLVKGDAAQAQQAAREHGILDTIVVQEVEHPFRGKETFLRVEPSAWGRSAAWYMEPDGPPYPAGTLLSFRFREEEAINAC